MSKTSPTSRALAECRARGWEAQVVEKWVPQARRRVDLFSCVDIVALLPPQEVGRAQWALLGIQVTSGSNHAARREKALAEPRILHWLQAGALFQVWSFTKKGKAGKRKLWELRTEEIHAEDFEP